MNTSHQKPESGDPIEVIDAVCETLAGLISIPIKHPEEIRQLHTVRDLIDNVVVLRGSDLDYYKRCCHTILCKAISQANVAERMRKEARAGTFGPKNKAKATRTDKPEPGKVYRLTGKSDEASVARGDKLSDCEVDE